MPFTIRNTFEDDDLAVLYKIEQECFAKEFRWAEPLFRHACTSARKSKLVWVAIIDGEIAGMLLAGEESDKIDKVVIETVNVALAHRRKGLASKLVAACERSLKKRGCKEILLEVHTENPAQILYFQLGYRACGFRRHYYKLHQHAISMSKKL